MTIGALDLLICAVVLLSVIVAGYRGLVREALALLVWVAAFVVASLFAGVVAASLGARIETEGLRFPLAFGGLFVATLIVGSLVTRALGMLVDATGLTGVDRSLGVLFGAARAGVLLVVVAALTAPLFADTAWWQASTLVPWLIAAQDHTFEFFRLLRDALLPVDGRT